MSNDVHKVFEFGPFRVDAAERVLLREGKPVPLTLKAFDVLLVLVENRGHVVEKDALMKRVWAGSFVEEGNLKVTVSMLRKVLEDNHGSQRFIETVPRRGYRFVAEVQEVAAERVDLIFHEHTRETLTIDETVVQPAQSNDRQWHNSLQHKLALGAISLVVLALSTAIAFFGLKYGRLSAKEPPLPFSNFKITSLTTSGRTAEAAISPDGKYLAYIVLDGTRRSLWMRHISTASEREIAGPEDGFYGNLTFSPNGDHLYYISANAHTLYQVPVLGGTPRKLLTDIDSTVALSPDGSQLAFMRGYPDQQRACLIVSNSDGSGERQLAIHHIGDLFLSGPHELAPSWSPDGNLIAFPFTNHSVAASGSSLMAVQVKDGVEKVIVSGSWREIGPICWLRDGGGLVFIAAEDSIEATAQIWHVSYPDGKAHRITNDLNSYYSLSLSADSGALVAVQSQQISNLWTTSNGYDDAVQVSSSKYDGQEGLAWTSDGKIVYVSRASGQPQIWITNADGTNKKQLTFDDSWKGRLSVSPDGRYVVFVSGHADTFHIWRMDLDGGNAVQLSRGRENRMPHVTFDSRWVVYTSFEKGVPTLWKVAITGGEPVQLTDYYSALLAISPQDGQIAYSYLYRDEQSRPSRRFALLPLSGGPSAKTVDFVVPNNVRWSTNGQALTYVKSPGGVSNIWSQPIDGSAASQLTNFTSLRIFRHDWSLDGKRLVLARGSWSTDAVMIRDLTNTK